MAAEVLAALIATAVAFGVYEVMRALDRMLGRTDGTPSKARAAALVGLPAIVFVLAFLSSLVAYDLS